MAPDFGDPTGLEAWKAFLTSYRRVLDLLEKELRASVGLSLAAYDVLVQLGYSPEGRLRMSELADRIVLSRSGLTRLIDRMETAGLVQRASYPTDRRGSLAVLTPAGRATLADAAPVHLEGVRRHFTSHLTKEEAKVLQRALSKVQSASIMGPAASMTADPRLAPAETTSARVRSDSS